MFLPVMNISSLLANRIEENKIMLILTLELGLMLMLHSSLLLPYNNS